MAISDAVQTLTAAFSFGILLQAATGALLIYFKGHGSTIFRDGRRLVLVLFLLFAALWAQVSFVNLLLIKPSMCHATLIFSTSFDQLARFSLEQFLLWSLAQRSKMNAGQLILQVVLGLRLIAGGILVGFTRPDFAPLCVAQTSLEPVAIVVLGFDAVIIGLLIIRSASMGILRDMKDSRSSTRDQSKGLVLTIIGFFSWTLTSISMIMGIPTVLFIVRTVVPANGLLILVVILTFSAGNLLDVREEIITPEAHSPFIVAPSAPSREIAREISREVSREMSQDMSREISREDYRRSDSGNGSPLSGPSYDRRGSLFVVNPSSTPRGSLTTTPASVQASALRSSKLGGEITAKDLGATDLAPRNIPGYRGSSGVFPTIATSSMSFGQGALAPNIVTNVLDSSRNVPMPPVPQPTSQQKRSLFSRSRQSVKPKIGSLKISKPIMNEDNDSSERPFARIQTIDLAQAASNERERREAAAERMRLVADRPAPQPPKQSTISAEDALRRSISVKRKEMPISQPRERMPTIANPSTLSVKGANGSTTSASLSPGREEVRRRSPRNINSFDALINEMTGPLPALRRQQTVGLPSNPRSNGIIPTQTMAKEQTVMLMNDIVYDNPSVVKTIISGAPEIYALAQKAKTSEKSPTASYTPDPNSSGSIIHRPRPYSKKFEGERALFPSEPSPGHRRTKSGPAVTGRKSIFMSHPGSPNKLPPLPARPTCASKLKRLLPNNTKSMTFDEKIELLFPAPPESLMTHKRRSSVPSLPRVPSVFMSEPSMMHSPTQDEQQSRRASKRTTIASFGLPEAAIEVSQAEQTKPQEQQVFRYSANTYRTLADEIDETWIPGIPVKETTHVQNLASDANNMESPILQKLRESHITDASSDNMSTDDDSTTYWGSIHSEIPPVDLSKVMRTAKSTFIQRSRAGTLAEIQPTLLPKEEESHNGEEIMTVMLDCEEGCQSTVTSSEDNRRSFFLDTDESLPGDKMPTLVKTWHLRIGDELPTFSDRKSSTRSRKMPPPTPLLLNHRGRGATVLLRGAEPSPPIIESPARAIAEIQAQLKRFEDPGRGSVGSILRSMPDAASTGNGAIHEDRLKLLENLEDEMGEQEDQWQQMQTDLHRDSVSTIATSYTEADSEIDISRASSQRSSRAPSRVVSRRARIRSSTTLRTLSTSTQSSDNSTASVWQQRLAEAQMEYMENAPALLGKRGLNFLSVSKSHQLGSPTPPESVDSGTDMETDSEVEAENEHATDSASKEAALLWIPQLPSPKAATGRLWNPPYETMDRAASPEPPAKNVRPAQRQIQASLHISSSGLWSEPELAAHSRPTVGLWGPKVLRPVSIRTRPVTQRPPRRSKRVTFLPDIVESPKPLPNKRDTLGIFQFPWGETSDSAVYQPTFNPALLSHPILNSQLDSRSRRLEPESEYSSSFFDDYDEDMDDYEAGESDDDFDETTLWEIASLLKSEDVPSKKSLLPPRREVIEDYDVEETTSKDGEEAEDIDQAAKVVQHPMTKLPIMPLLTAPKQEIEEKSMLWASELATPLQAGQTGLPQPDRSVWQAYIPSADDTVRSKPRPSEHLPSLASDDLWATSASEGSNLSASPMWSGSTTPTIIPNITSEPKQVSSKMWTPAPQVESIPVLGLFSISHSRPDYRQTILLPAAQNVTIKSRSSHAPLPQLTSTTLWSSQSAFPYEHHWISESSIRPTSPSVYSETSSGRSSPVSETSSISNASLKSASTKASSLWGSIKSASTFEWLDVKASRNSPSLTQIQNSNMSSKLPVAKGKALESVRESRVLANRDLWEATLPVSSAEMLKKKSSFGKSFIPVPTMAEKVDRQPLRQTLRRNVTFKANWDEALAEAVAAGTPKKMLSRPTVSKADWDAALQEAVSKSQMRLQRPMATLETWAAALEEAVAKSTTAVVTASQRHDPAVLHPVFFTSSLVSSISEIHPAAIGHVTKPQPKTLWTAPRSYVANLEAPVGPMWWKGKVAAAQFEHDRTPTIRTPVVSRSATLPKLESTNIWQLTRYAPVVERNWITVDSNELSPGVKKVEGAIRGLNSTSTPSTPVPSSAVATAAPKALARSQTWTAKALPQVSNEEETRMWTSQPTLAIVQLPTLFSNIQADPWVRKKRSNLSVEFREEELESRQMWSRNWAMPESPKEWLVRAEKIVSKVQFRY